MSVEKIDELTPIVDGLADNKACVFAYTEQAYQDNDVTGVSQYDFSKEQNIPDKNSTDTNPQVLTKGFRSQGSSIPRNFINHFIGRFSYNLNKIIDVFQSFIKAYKTDYQKNGFMYNATLPYQVGDVCMDVWSDNTFAFFVRTGNGGSTGVRPMVASDNGWTVNEHWSCLGTPQGTSQSFILRDSAGRAQVASPSAANDIANKSYVDSTATAKADAVQTKLTSHINNQDEGVHGSTSAATAGKLMIRDSAGRAQVANPSAASDIANKSYVDGKTWDAASDITGVLPISKGGTGASTQEKAFSNIIPRCIYKQIEKFSTGDATYVLIAKIKSNSSGKYYSSGFTGIVMGRRGGVDAFRASCVSLLTIQVGSHESPISVYIPCDDGSARATPCTLTFSGEKYTAIKLTGVSGAVRYVFIGMVNEETENPFLWKQVTNSEVSDVSLGTNNLSLPTLGVTASAAELNYCDGLTGNIQQQINAISATGVVPYKKVGILKANVEFLNSFTVREDGWYLLCFRHKGTSNNYPVGSPMYLPASSTFIFDGYLNLSSGIIGIANATIPGSTNTLRFTAAVSNVNDASSVTLALYEMVT